MSRNVKRIKYIDALKFLAIAGVLFLHCFNIVNPVMVKGINLYDFHQFGRFGVPIFLCVSGALLLNKKNYELSEFLKKRLVRICYPLIFFSAILILINYTKDFFTAFWYSWMILGAYLTIPFINKIIQNSTMKEIEIFLLICCFTSIFYQIASMINVKFSLDLNFFITPVTYLVLGYYLSKKEFSIKTNYLLIISILVMIITTILKMEFGNTFYIYPQLEVLYLPIDLGIIQIIQCSSVFLFVRFIYEDGTGVFSSIKNILEKEKINKFIVSVSRASYGIYMVHMVIMLKWIRPFFKAVKLSGKEMLLLYIITFISLFLFSWIVTLILSRIPYIDKFSGYA